MLSEPCIHQSLYTDAVVIIIAESAEEALLQLEGSGEEGWLIEDLRRLPPRVFPLDTPSVLFTDIRCE